MPGDGSVVLRLCAGDRVSLVNDEGGQPCELIAFAPNGKPDVGLIGMSGDGTGSGLKQIIRREGTDCLTARRLAREAIDLSLCTSTIVFSKDS